MMKKEDNTTSSDMLHLVIEAVLEQVVLTLEILILVTSLEAFLEVAEVALTFSEAEAEEIAIVRRRDLISATA